MSKRRRRVQDKWRMKEWYNINSPAYFGGKMIASVPAGSEDSMIGRTIEVTLYDITEDFSKQHIKLHFQVVSLKQKKAETIFKGHEYTRDYLRSLVRRGSTRIDGIFNLTTKDGYGLRISVVAFSITRIRKTQILSIKNTIKRVLNEKGEILNFDQFVQEAVLGKIASDIYNEAKKIIPVRHVGIRKSKVISFPTKETTETTTKVEVSANT